MALPTKARWAEVLREFPNALRNVPRAFSLLRDADPGAGAAMAALTVAAAALPVSQAWVFKLIVDGVVHASAAGMTAREGLLAVAPWLGLELALVLASAAISQFHYLLEELVQLQLEHLIVTRIVRKALSLEISAFEDAEFYDRMQRARRQADTRAMAAVSGAFNLVRSALTLGSFLVLLLSFNPWIALVLLGAAIPAFIIQSRYSQLSFRLQSWKVPETRVMGYLEQLLTSDTAVKEVKLFRLGEPLLARHSTIFAKLFAEDRALASSRSIRSLLWGMLAVASYYGACLWIIAETVTRRITLGDMTLYLTLFRQSQTAFQGLLESVAKLYENGLFLENLFGFLGRESAIRVLNAAERPAEDPSRGLELEDVWFRYPGREEWTLQGLTLQIRPGEKLALVGENGAGKTTLIKLLTRLIEPARGRVLYRGVDLRFFSESELHKRIGAIFQDFVRYHLTLRENIGFGEVEFETDLERVRAAAERGGADGVVTGLPKGYESILGRWFDGGQELSGGQWQKIAISRAFMRDAEVVILDEPTASLDAGAEYEVFQRFRRLTEGKIALVVSHRFSTVRMADRIIVLRDGKIEEQGSHAELVSARKTYARLFELQAEGYR
jgi:ATP-binding cassette subfamily B protein